MTTLMALQCLPFTHSHTHSYLCAGLFFIFYEKGQFRLQYLSKGHLGSEEDRDRTASGKRMTAPLCEPQFGSTAVDQSSGVSCPGQSILGLFLAFCCY